MTTEDLPLGREAGLGEGVGLTDEQLVSRHPISISRTTHSQRLSTALLELVARQPAHAYSLCATLSGLGFEIGDRSVVYQRLRDLERRRLVSSVWETTSGGPARRIYTATAAGLAALRGAAEAEQRR